MVLLPPSRETGETSEGPYPSHVTLWRLPLNGDGLIDVTARVDATHVQGDDRAVLLSDWYHSRSSHSEAWTLSKHS